MYVLKVKNGYASYGENEVFLEETFIFTKLEKAYSFSNKHFKIGRGDFETRAKNRKVACVGDDFYLQVEIQKVVIDPEKPSRHMMAEVAQFYAEEE